MHPKSVNERLKVIQRLKIHHYCNGKKTAYKCSENKFCSQIGITTVSFGKNNTKHG